MEIDALLPKEMAEKAERVGVSKASMALTRTFALSVLAGAFIAFGALFATTVSAGASTLPWGVTRLLAGTVFSLGLVLVIVGGAELFTGNNLIVMAWASRRVTTVALFRNWAVVYVGNLVGSLATAVLVFVGGQYRFGGGAVGAAALAIARAKVELEPLQAVALGILCNTLVCLAVWLTFSARTTTDRILAIVPPIACFVAAGFEHSIANMYFVPYAMLVHELAPDSFFVTIGQTRDTYAMLRVDDFLLHNLLPVTLGNVIGGVACVGLVYWAVYLRGRAHSAKSTDKPPRL